MKFLRKLRNYVCYCGIEKDEFNAVKKDAYISNFVVWRILHFLMTVSFAVLFISSLFNELLKTNLIFYLGALIYSVIAVGAFFVLKKDSIIAQFFIYLSISMLFLFGCFITQNKPDMPATMFFTLLLITPMFMIDRPYFMAIEMTAASAVFIIWMHGVKPYNVWRLDLINIFIYLTLGIFLHVIANSIRIKEFVLTKKINIQKDTDDMTGLKNKGALTGEINKYLANKSTDKGKMFLLDIDRFKSINDTYGHDVGDDVIRQVGDFLRGEFKNGEIVGRFGGDEFIVFIKDTDSTEAASAFARDIISGTARTVTLPDENEKISVSIGISVYHGEEKNYSEIFKKADIALYKAKADNETQFCFY